MQIELDNVSLLKSIFESGENSEISQQKIADFFPTIIYVYNADQKKIRYINKKLTDVLGYTHEDIESHNYDFLKFVFKQDQALVEQELDKCRTLKDNDTRSFISRFVDKNGDRRFFRTHTTWLRRNDEGDSAEFLFVSQDITDVLHFEEETRTSKDLLKETEKLLHSGTFQLDISNNKLEWSDGMYLLFGYDPVSERSTVKIDDEFYRLHMTEPDLTEARAQLQDALKNNDNYIIETPIRTKQDTDKRLETFGKIVRDEAGKPIKIIGITRDITKLKDYEKTLQEKLEELNESNKELEEFAYIASHDLQEPLRKITAFSERLHERSGHEMGQDGQMYLQRILTATQNMRTLIDNLLEFSRTNRHNDPLEKIDLNLVMKEVVSDLELKIEETNAVISYSSLPVISSYHSQMKQLFTNILSNAIKFRKPAEAPVVTIASEVLNEKDKAELTLSRDKKYFKITISDSGIGFEPEYALKIFQIFQRLHGKAEYPGTGIGLAICKKIVENHNGVMFAESSPGQGAVFTVILPENQ